MRIDFECGGVNNHTSYKYEPWLCEKFGPKTMLRIIVNIPSTNMEIM